MSDTRNKFIIKIDATKRLFLWHVLSKKLHLILVSEYPKSGGTWLSKLLADYFEIDFPRNKIPRLQKSVMHGHFLYSENFYNPVILLRDGRDVMVSAYYHFLFFNERNSHNHVTKIRNLLNFDNYDDIKTNLPKFIEYMFCSYSKGIFKFSWSQFINSWIDKDVTVVKYESLLQDTRKALEKVLLSRSELKINYEKLEEIVYKNSFSQQSKKFINSQSHNFLRKGISGDWKNHFSKEACQVFNKFGGDELIKSGYEKNRNWF